MHPSGAARGRPQQQRVRGPACLHKALAASRTVCRLVAGHSFPAAACRACQRATHAMYIEASGITAAFAKACVCFGALPGVAGRPLRADVTRPLCCRCSWVGVHISAPEVVSYEAPAGVCCAWHAVLILCLGCAVCAGRSRPCLVVSRGCAAVCAELIPWSCATASN